MLHPGWVAATLEDYDGYKMCHYYFGVIFMKIMIVDDSPTIRNIEKNVLVQLGYRNISEAGDGVEALSLMALQMPDLFLVGWDMPNMDGLTLVRNIRAANPHVPIIMVTTGAEKSRVLKAVKAGVNNYVVKPFTAEVLSEKINQTLAKCGVAV